MIDQDAAHAAYDHARYDRARGDPEERGPSAGAQKLFWIWTGLWCAVLLFIFFVKPFSGELTEGTAAIGWLLAPLLAASVGIIGGTIILLVGRQRRRR